MKKKIVIVCLLNLIILCLTGMKIYRNAREDILLSDVAIKDNERYREVFDPITEGVYSVTVEYQATDNYKVKCGGTGNQYPGIYGEEHWLKASETVKKFRFWVNGRIDAPYIWIEHDDTNGRTEGFSLDVKSIRITRQYRASLLYGLLKMAAVLGTVDVLYFAYLKRSALRKHAYVILGLLIIFLTASMGVFAPGQVSGHDLYFHLARIRGTADAVMTGEFPVKMQPEWFNGYGHPVSVFYGDALLYVPAALYMLNIPLEFCYKIYVLLINMGTILISYFCFKRISKDRYIGVVCTAVYTLSVVRIINVYLRAAVGEYSAAMFLPLIALAMWGIFTSDTKNKAYPVNSALLCIGMTGIIQTHIISLEMTGIFLIIICCMNIKKVFRKATFQVLAKSVVMTLLVNAGFFIPFLDYSRENLQIFSERDFYGIQGFGLSLYELFSVNTSGIGRANIPVGGLRGRIPVSLGLTGMLVIVLLAFVVIRNLYSAGEKRIIMQVLILTGFTLWFATYYFPWNYLADIKYVQNIIFSIEFPWRFITISMVFISIAAGVTLRNLKRGPGEKYIKLIMAGLCMIAAYQGLQCMDMIERNMNISEAVGGGEVMRLGMTLEYAYNDLDIESVMTDNRVHGENADIMGLDRSGNRMAVSYKSKENAFLELPIFAYPYYQCTDMETGKKFVIERSSNNSRIRICVPDNYEGTVEVYFVQPWHWRAAEIVSLISFFATAVYTFMRRNDIFDFRGQE